MTALACFVVGVVFGAGGVICWALARSERGSEDEKRDQSDW